MLTLDRVLIMTLTMDKLTMRPNKFSATSRFSSYSPMSSYTCLRLLLSCRRSMLRLWHVSPSSGSQRNGQRLFRPLFSHWLQVATYKFTVWFLTPSRRSVRSTDRCSDPMNSSRKLITWLKIQRLCVRPQWCSASSRWKRPKILS